MEKLFNESISWDLLKDYEDRCHFHIDEVIYKKSDKTLNLIISLNFIIPYQNMLTIQNEILCKFAFLNDVQLIFNYKDLIISKKDILNYFMQYLLESISKDKQHLLKAINQKDYCINEKDEVLIYSVGEVATETLNALVSEEMMRIIEEQFGFKIDVRFKNCEDTYQKYLVEKKIELAEIEKVENTIKTKQKEETKKMMPVKEGVIFGRQIKEEPVPIKSIDSSAGSIAIEGVLYKKSDRDIKNNKKLVTLIISDLTDAITCKAFITEEKYKKIDENLRQGDVIKVKGTVGYDTFEEGIALTIKDIEKKVKEGRKDNREKKRIELHVHSKMSAMDGLISPGDIVKRAAEWGHKAIAITDHGVVQGFPEAMEAAQKHGIKVIYGVEGYLVDDITDNSVGESGNHIDDEYVIFDLETTGLSSKNDRIIEIGAVKIKNMEVIDSFTTLINPEKNITLEITQLTGIDNDMVKSQPRIHEILDKFLDFIGESTLVAHNAAFDMAFLKEACAKNNKSLHNLSLDTILLTKLLIPKLKRHKLDVVAKELNIAMGSHHRALDDAKTAAQILLKLFKKMKSEDIFFLADLSKKKKMKLEKLSSSHIILLVKNYAGLKNLYRIISESHINYFYKKPRIPRSLLNAYREGLIVGSACEAGEVYQSILLNESEEKIKKIMSYYDYLEVQPLDNNNFLIEQGRVKDYKELIHINKKIISLGERMGKPVVATSDAHYLNQEDYIYRAILMAGQGYKDIENKSSLFMKTTEEMLNEFDYLDQDLAQRIVIDNPNFINDQIEEILPIPSGTFPPSIEGSDEKLREMCWKKAKMIYGESLPDIVEKRLERELNSIISNGYAVMYVIAQKLVEKSLSDGYLVGSRGSVGSSFAATMSSITEVNPLPPHYICPNCKNSEFILDGSYGCGVDMPDKNCPNCGEKYNKDGFDIPFEVFLGFEGDKEPDIDLNFAGEYQPNAHKYCDELFGEDKVFRAGTIGTVAGKTAYGFVMKYYEEKEDKVSKWEIDRISNCCTGVRRTTGQHPGGVMIVPRDKDIYDFCPIQYPANDERSGVRTTHFDYHSISGRLLKLDILGHDVPTIIRALEDMTGVSPFDIPLKDEKVDEIFLSAKSLDIKDSDYRYELGSFGVPEFGTKFVRQMLQDTKPSNFSDLIRISGLSHGTDVWINNAQELVKNGLASISDVIATRDDIMNYLIYKGVPDKSAFKIMENVRKGKGLSSEEIELMKENDIPSWYIESCQRIKYMFPKAHAVAYVMMSYRIAYFKVYYPIQFYAVFFSTKVADFNADVIFGGKKEVLKRIDQIEVKGNNGTQKEKDELIVLEVAYEMYARGFEFLPVSIDDSEARRFIVLEDKILPPFSSLQGLGENAAMAIVKERNRRPFTSAEDMKERAKLNKTALEALRSQGVLRNMSESDQLSLFLG